MITPTATRPVGLRVVAESWDTAEVKAIESGHDARVYMLAFYLEAR
jgi:hypothetical protein